MEIDQHCMTKEEKKLILASSLGTIFEWYDFYLYGYVAVIIAKHFFSDLEPQIAFIFSLFAFACGFLFRPLGAVIFGHLGDLLGRKYVFLSTILIMGVATFIVGLLPTYQQIGIWAPSLLIFLRIIQGLAMGGEYGGAIIYVAEFAPDHRRGLYTSWVQIAPCFGYFSSVMTILLFQSFFGTTAFETWAWRLPFLISIFYLIFSLYLRVKMQESTAFHQLKLNGGLSYSPFRETFFQWKYLKWVLISLFGAILGQTVSIGVSNLYVLYFLTEVLKVDSFSANLCLSISLIVYLFCIIFFASLSDKIGRKKLMVIGCFLATISIYPVYQGITWSANPQLAHAQYKYPIVLKANLKDCHYEWQKQEDKKKHSPCDIVRASLIKAGVSYVKINQPELTMVQIYIGQDSISLKDTNSRNISNFQKKFQNVLSLYHYPISANTAEINYIKIILYISYLMAISAMILGPLGVFLIELFPTRIRYTGMSFPYHFGNGVFGGFLPMVCFSIVLYTGNMFSGLWYAIFLSAVSFIVGLLFIPETKNRNIHAIDHNK